MLNSILVPMPETTENENEREEELTAELWLRRRKKVMIIDDDINFRLAISEMLVDQGFSVMTAKDGEMALNYLVHNPDRPDIILVDLMMPIKGGLEFRREQAQLDEIKDIPVIFVTGCGLVDGEICLQKPFDEEEFISILKRYT